MQMDVNIPFSKSINYTHAVDLKSNRTRNDEHAYSSSPEESTDSIDGVFLACMHFNKEYIRCHCI